MIKCANNYSASLQEIINRWDRLLPKINARFNTSYTNLGKFKPGESIYVPAGKRLRTYFGPGATNVEAVPGIGIPLGTRTTFGSR